jgi:dipeptidase E
MGLVDYVIVPHFRSAHPESKAAERASAWLEQQSIPFRTLRDGESIITNEAA